MATDTIPHRLFEQARRRPTAPAYATRDATGWRTRDWRAYADEVRRAARALIALGVEPGDKTCILGFNRPEWVIFDVATMAVGGAPVGLYTTSSPSEVRYILEHSESPVVLVENAAHFATVQKAREGAPRLRRAVCMQGAGVEDPLALDWAAFLALGDDVDDARVDERLAALEPEGLATLIYTSGTTGPPKGVMLTHRNLTWTADALARHIGADERFTSLSYLPLSHIAEQVLTIHGAITNGAPVYFARSLETLAEDLREVQPVLFFGVPRVWEKFASAVQAKLAAATGARKRLVEWATGVARRVVQERSHGRTPGPALAVQYALAQRLVLGKLKPLLGFGNVRIAATGAAPISAEVLTFFAGLDVPIYEVYGQSEVTGPTSFNKPGKFRFGTVGPALDGVTVRIAEDGEILVRGPNVFKGYYKDAAATAETLEDGWLRSGDLGEVDREGFLRITGRKKDILITAGGKNITPVNVELALKNVPLVNEAVVVGDRRKYLTALLTLDPEGLAAFARAQGIPEEHAHEHPKVLAELQKGIDAANEQFARVEQVKKFRVLARNLSVDSGELTPSLKVKRRVVVEKYADLIEGMYAETDARAAATG